MLIVHWLNLFAKFSVTERTAGLMFTETGNTHLWTFGEFGLNCCSTSEKVPSFKFTCMYKQPSNTWC